MTMLSKGYKRSGGQGGGSKGVAASGIEALSSRASTGSRKSMPKMASTQSATKAIYKNKAKEQQKANRYVKTSSTKPAPAKKAPAKKAPAKKAVSSKPKSEKALSAEYKSVGSDTSHLPPVNLTGKQFNGKA
jgi:hypothetical protein